jgi:chromosome partitioning protein
VRIVSIINQKGGCGKTTSAINLAGIFARRGYRTLLVDMDPQSHCAAGLAIPEQRIDLDIGDAMLVDADRALDKSRLLWRASRNLDLAPSRMKLAGLEASRGGLADKTENERRLAGVLARLGPSYDICFIDCSPSIGLLTFNALAAATHILIPVETSFFALQGATKQVNTIRTLARRLGGAAEYWLIATLHDESSVLSRDLLEELRRRFGTRVAPVAIRRDVALKEAASFGQPVIEYSPSSPGAHDYCALADWLGARLGLTAGLGSGRPAVPAGPGAVHIEPKGGAERGTPPAVPGPATGPAGPGAPVEPSPEVGAAPADGAGAAGSAAARQGAVPQEDPAERARVLLLKRADEQLRRIIVGGSSAGGSSARGGGGPAAAVLEAAVAAPVVVEVAERGEAAEAGGAVPETDPLIVEPRPVNVKVPQSLPRIEQLRNFFGVRQTRSGVLFVQPLTLGTWVSIAGDFNNWSPDKLRMRRNEELGVFEACLELPPGRRRYRLVVEGRWMTDPSNPRCEPNEYGEFNSIIDVALPAGAPART